MKPFHLVAFVLVLALALQGGLTPAGAQTDEFSDFALFYEALAPYGKWIDYGKYGPVWYPTGVSEDWRPYLNGRWVPTEEGWVFETEEPWGWATYHYGNWFPTIEYGWVWAPGSTWYPSTAVWRTSDDYIGWAPLPPPEYEPVPAFYPEWGYYPGVPRWDLLTPPFWTFCPTSSFFLGFGQPFLPSYSYWNCGCLAPFTWSPFLAFRTYFLPDFFFPSFAPTAFFAFGPAFPFIARVTNINIININDFAKKVHFRGLRNVLPPKNILDRHPFIRKAIPDPVFKGERFSITPVKDRKLAETNLLRANATPLPVGVPKVSREIPKALALPHRQRVGPEALKGVKGMALPAKAISPSTSPPPALKAPQPVAPAESRQGPARLETREDAGARMIEVVPPGRRLEKPQAEPRVIRGAPPTIGPAEEVLRRQQQEQFKALERRQQQVLDGQRQERESLRQRQLRQQDIFRDQQRLLEQRQLKQQESLQRQREELRLEQQMQRRELQRQQQFRREGRPPRGGASPTLRQVPMRQAPARQSIQLPGRAAPRGGAVGSSSGRSSGGQGRSTGSSRGGSMGFGGLGR
jgi:hypothetical protein